MRHRGAERERAEPHGAARAPLLRRHAAPVHAVPEAQSACHAAEREPRLAPRVPHGTHARGLLCPVVVIRGGGKSEAGLRYTGCTDCLNLIPRVDKWVRRRAYSAKMRHSRTRHRTRKP